MEHLIWNANIKPSTPLKKRKETIQLIIHCTATPEGRPCTVTHIDTWHRHQNKWACIGYHYVIYADGKIVTGRPEEYVGAHTSGQNSNSIGICYVGGLTKDGGKAKDTRTEEQKESMVWLCKQLMKKYDITPAHVHGHNEYTNKKACPCFDVRELRNELTK